MTRGEPLHSVDSKLTMVDTWLLSFESWADGAPPVEVRPGLQDEEGPEAVPPAAAMRDSSSSVRPCLAKGAGSTPRRVNLSAKEAKQRRAPSDTLKTQSLKFRQRKLWKAASLREHLRVYLVIFMLEETGQRLDTRLQRRVLRLHLAAEARHHCHGRVQSVFVDQVATVSDEA